jgi:hypothetical protein
VANLKRIRQQQPVETPTFDLNPGIQTRHQGFPGSVAGSPPKAPAEIID